MKQITATITFFVSERRDDPDVNPDWDFFKMWEDNDEKDPIKVAAANIKWCLEQEHHGIADYESATVSNVIVKVA